MKNVFITGANRGIGLELVKQCLDMKYEVVATHRKNSDIKKLFQWYNLLHDAKKLKLKENKDKKETVEKAENNKT